MPAAAGGSHVLSPAYCLNNHANHSSNHPTATQFTSLVVAVSCPNLPSAITIGIKWPLAIWWQEETLKFRM